MMKALLKRVIRKILRPFRFFILELLGDYEVENKQLKKKEISDSINCKGPGLKLNGVIRITHADRLFLGSNVHIGDNAFFFTMGGLIIGDNTHFSRNVTIYTANHDYSGNALPYDNTYSYKPVSIGANVWVGMNVSISPGVTIGDGAIIGIGSVVTRDVKEFQIVGDQGPVFYKERDVAHYNLLKGKRNFGGINGVLLSSSDEILKKKTAKLKESKIIFVVGTGRCGTTTMARVLNQHPKIYISHESNRMLIWLSTQFAHKQLSFEKVKRILEGYLLSLSIFDEDLIYADSDQKYGNLIPVLNIILPKAKFIHVFRDAVDTINSMYSRGWFDNKEFNYNKTGEYAVDKYYDKGEFSLYRINGLKVGEFTEDEWINASSFERCVWYYFYWNKLIEQDLKSISSPSFLLKIEDMNTNLEKLTDFMEVSDYNFEVGIHNVSSDRYDKKDTSSWVDKQREIYLKYQQLNEAFR